MIGASHQEVELPAETEVDVGIDVEGYTALSRPFAVSVESPGSVLGIPSLTQLQFEFVVGNIGDEDDTYDLVLTTTQGWVVNAAPATLDIGAGGQESIVILVTVPPGTPVGAVEEITLRATSHGNPNRSSADVSSITVIDVGRSQAIEFLGEIITSLPDDEFGDPEHRDGLLSDLIAIADMVSNGDFSGAAELLGEMRTHVDGCDGSAAAQSDNDDWINLCDAQYAARALIDAAIVG